MRAGDFVIAIGSPMQLQNSASFGIVSATARHASELGLSNNRSEYIQTDAAINIGNSGGPLVNLDGQVIGINTMKVKGTDGISLAIPMDIAAQIIDQLSKHGKVTRPFVGLKMTHYQEPIETAKRSRKKTALAMMVNDADIKVMVMDVIASSPASQAGFQSGDIIMEVNGKEVKSMRDVLEVIGLEVGKTIQFKVKRHSVGEITLTLTTAPER
mmetsp:Transcript_11629/g.16004  ORF Transcript_11629/g.16004 Transcript_11629/m.16004 type:complete len:213 (+) Transcript_11629:2-640(+)